MSKKTTRLEDLAERAGVSVSTASRALNDSPAVSTRTKRAIWQLAREMDYPFRRHMPAGPIGAKATVSIVVPKPQGRTAHLSDPFFFELLAGVGDAARERGCDIHISHVAPASFEDLHAAMTTHRADGVIFVGQSGLHHAFNQLAESETQFVVWGAELPEQNYCSVGSDNLLGGRRATQHLARLGRKRIVFLGETEAPEAMQRYRGYRGALESAGLAEDPDLLVPAQFSPESAQSAVDGLIGRGIGFDAIVAASDLMALGAMRALHRGGMRVPQDVGLVGYDNISYARYSEPALTTIDQDVANAGRLMLAKLLDGQSGSAAPSERLATDLIVRESCGS